MVEDRDDDLVRLAAATRDIECDDAFTDALMSAIEPDGDALERISRTTATIEPAASFTDAIMATVQPTSVVRPRAESPTGEGVVRSGRAAVVLAGLVAAASVFFAVYTEDQLDSDVMSSVEVIE